MIRRLSLALLPVAALAGCHQQAMPSGNETAAATATPAANVAATAPEGRDWSSVVTRTADSGYRMGNPPRRCNSWSSDRAPARIAPPSTPAR